MDSMQAAMQNPELLLGWSASLDANRLTFHQYVDQTEGSEHVDSFRSCADDAGHSVRVAEGTLPTTGGR